MDLVEISAGRLHLRPWSPDDADELLAACQDAEIQHWTKVPSPYLHHDAVQFLAGSDQRWATDVATWAVCDATTGALLASCALRVTDDHGSIGYWCVAEARGQGVATDAVQAVCRWGFGALGLDRITWRAEVGNLASRAVAEKAGFTVEGVRRRLLMHRGEPQDAWIGSLLSTDTVVDRRALPAPPVLTDGVVTLRGWRAADAPDLARACDDELTARWVPVPKPYTLADADAYLGDHVTTAWADGTAAELAVTDAVTGELLGAIGLKLGGRRLRYGEIGYWTAPWARGRGVAGRGTTLMAGWGLTELGLHRVELLSDVENLASQRAAEKAGFVREGVSRRSRPDRDGTPRDMVLFSFVVGDDS